MERGDYTGPYPLTHAESAKPPLTGLILLVTGVLLPVYAVSAALIYSLVAP